MVVRERGAGCHGKRCRLPSMYNGWTRPKLNSRTIMKWGGRQVHQVEMVVAYIAGQR